MEDIEKNSSKSMHRKQLSRELTYYIQKNDLEKLDKLLAIENNFILVSSFLSFFPI